MEKPSLFIKVTCKPEWPEIKAAPLGPNDKACTDRPPDLIARVPLKAKSGNKRRAGSVMNGESFLCCSPYCFYLFNLC
ncbi:BZ3500_MvSof-1268-A1-R1_Chr10-1g02534 [Microbotryum saponariae]|uniref:BZ3500_MvSof-1268-A1-R1_Chr10-1g02534 protein n=1 Tax=Microbotryum saponariae TaxID=289078 RepID=A0A2X0M287_9BASI|nr:BZ3500_MvSof-1268-A1-R1_Chr10-1g02534 [Microbotryum saponariae]SDA06023.1 BZ3501_MvSof-1269-A2-R1_Chr10-1g02135 [Microbotryum saponariae]